MCKYETEEYLVKKLKAYGLSMLYISDHSKVDTLKKHADRHVWWSFPDLFLVLEGTYGLCKLWDLPPRFITQISVVLTTHHALLE